MRSLAVLLLLTAVAAGGCGSPKVLAAHDLRGGKAIMLVYQEAGAQNPKMADAGGLPAENPDGELYDFIVRVCDLDQQNSLVNCKETLVVPNVVTQTSE